MEILSAGTSGSSAEFFFERIRTAGATSVIDIRLHRSSQLAGFAKQRDLEYFVPKLGHAAYAVESLLAPENDALKAYRSKSMTWAEYEQRYVSLIDRRNVLRTVDFLRWGERPVLVCSESEPSHCHRRLAAEYLQENLTGPLSVTSIRHL